MTARQLQTAFSRESRDDIRYVKISDDVTRFDSKNGFLCATFRALAKKQRQWTAQNVSPPSECTVPSVEDESDNDQSLAFAESLFFKRKGKNKKPLASTPVPKRREADVEKKLPRTRAVYAAERPSKKGTKKKGKAGSSGVDEPTLILFLERSKEKDEAFMERMAEGEREYRKDQQKLTDNFGYLRQYKHCTNLLRFSSLDLGQFKPQ
ncbi:hypothetical protein ACROYT_G027287 [Oculina patagonica]